MDIGGGVEIGRVAVTVPSSKFQLPSYINQPTEPRPNDEARNGGRKSLERVAYKKHKILVRDRLGIAHCGSQNSLFENLRTYRKYYTHLSTTI